MANDALQSNQQQLLTPRPSKEDSTLTTWIVPKGYRQRGDKAPQDVNLNLTNTNLIVSSKRN
jgi:hypothetical protein